MDKKAHIKDIFSAYGCDDFKWIEPQRIVVAQWVRLKCQFGCAGYGKSLSCPPNTPTVAECRQFFKAYNTSVIFHFTKSVDKPEDRYPWSKEVNEKLLSIERDVFLLGFYKVFVLPINECRLCPECLKKQEACKFPKLVRPVPESMAVDLFATARDCGYPIDVLTDYNQVMNRYALLMIE